MKVKENGEGGRRAVVQGAHAGRDVLGVAADPNVAFGEPAIARTRALVAVIRLLCRSATQSKQGVMRHNSVTMSDRLAVIVVAGVVFGAGCASRVRVVPRPSSASPAPVKSATPALEVAQEPKSAADAVPRGDCMRRWCWENPLPHGEAMRAVWGSAPDDYWASGEEGVLLHFDGTRWSRVDLPELFVSDQLFGRAPNDVYAIGVWPRHFDGRRWTKLPDAPSRIGEREVVGGFSEQGTPWILTDRGAVSTFDGTRWTERLPSSCRAMVCQWFTYRTASGGVATPRPDGSGWDGTFKMAGLPSPVGRTFGGTRESSLVLVRAPIFGVVQAWRNGSWVVLPVPDAATPRKARPLLRSIWGASDDDVWVVGKGGALYHFDGTSFEAFDSGTRGELWDVWGTSHDDAWAVGDSMLLHWDGRSWTPARKTVSDAALNGVWAGSGCSAWAVGDAGTVLQRDCAGWKVVPSGVSRNLYGVWGSNADDVLVRRGRRDAASLRRPSSGDASLADQGDAARLVGQQGG